MKINLLWKIDKGPLTSTSTWFLALLTSENRMGFLFVWKKEKIYECCKIISLFWGRRHGYEKGMITVRYVRFWRLVQQIYILLCTNVVCIQQDHFELLFGPFASSFLPWGLCMLATTTPSLPSLSFSTSSFCLSW